MSIINFFGLGGLDERDKRCFVLGVDDQYFVFNIGISIPSFSRLGIKKIAPDFSWIEKNKNKIKGIFISSVNFDNVGGLLHLNNVIKDIPIYTSEIGKVILESFFNKNSMKNIRNYSDYIVKVVKPLEEIKLGSSLITPFLILNSSPNSLGFAFNTKDGAVIILDDFMIGTENEKCYKNNIYQINQITKNNNLLLISSVGNVSKPYGFTSPNHDSMSYIEKEIDIFEDRRNIITCYDSDLFTIFKIINYAQKMQLGFSIHNNVLYNLINKFISINILDCKKLLFFPISKVNEMKKGIILIAYNKQKIFNTITSICTNNEEFIIPQKNDKFILAMPTTSGFESIEANVIDLIASIDLKWSKLPKNILEMKASSEDHKLLVDMLKPKYIIPTSGLYYEFLDYKNIIKGNSCDENNILLLENGQSIYFENKIYNKGKTKWMELHEKYLGTNQEFGDVNASLLSERKLMSENGVVFISALIKKNNADIKVTNFDLSTYGVLSDTEFMKDNLDKLKENLIQMIIDGYKDKNISQKELKNSLKKATSKFYEKNIFKTPLVLSTLIDR
ncbi:MAG: ribonuclease J [Mycoplasmoidaceae bacterium]